MIKNLKNDVKPSRWFAFKMRCKLYGKFSGLHLTHFFGRAQVAPRRRFKFAGVILLAVLTLSSGVGVYAYASPDVTVLSPLYPVKQGLESAEYLFARTPGEQAALNRKRAMRRMAEVDFLSHSMKKSSDPDWEEDGLTRTMAMMEGNMRSSLENAAEENETGHAREIMNDMHDDFVQMNDQLASLGNREHIIKAKDISAKLDKMRRFTKVKIQKIEEAALDIDTAMQNSNPRIYIRRIIIEQE